MEEGQDHLAQLTLLLDADAEEDGADLNAFFANLAATEKVFVTDRLSDSQRQRLLSRLDARQAALLLDEIAAPQSRQLLGDLEPEEASEILEKLPSRSRVDLLREIPSEMADSILAAMDAVPAQNTRDILQYPSGSAGSLMATEFLSFPENLSVRELLYLLRSQHGEYRQYPIQYIYVTQKGRTLRGVLRLRDLLLALPQARLQDLMIPDPASLQDAASLREISHFFDTHPFLAAPVIDDNQRLLGVLSRRRIKELRQDDAEEALRKRSGILGGDELRTLPLASRCLRRLSWLGPNILLSVLAASVIARSLHAVEAVTTLAVFLPIVSDMSGCSGNQAVAVTMRELTIGVLKPTEYLRVLAKEWLPGLINGAVLGITLGIIAAIWKENLWLGVVVGSALGLNTLFSVLLGGIVPLLLRRFRVDPALASNPLLTTSTDMVGFFLVLNFASLALSKLT